MKAGQTVGHYELIRQIGAGGNATVWEARRSGTEDSVALKILKSRTTGEPYQRFRREIDQVKRLGHIKGIVPIIDSSLPSIPSSTNPAWLAMPIMQTLRDHLKLVDADLHHVVTSTSEAAHILADLAELGVAHRDIKPENLYVGADGSCVIGDFGLVDAPDVEPLTSNARAVGPRHYIAPEMINDPANADGRPADVYSLAKTLWVLSTSQNYPLPGEHRRDVAALLLSTYIGHPLARLLDRLIERSTRTDPAGRPTMREVQDELSKWLDLETNPAPRDQEDISMVAQLVRDELEGAVERDRARLARHDETRAVLDRLVEGAHPLITALDDHKIAHQGFQDNHTILEALHAIRANVEIRVGRCLVLSQLTPRPVYLWAGFAVDFTSPDNLTLTAAHLVGEDSTGTTIVWSAQRKVVLGAVSEHVAIQELASELKVHLGDALRAYHRLAVS